MKEIKNNKLSETMRKKALIKRILKLRIKAVIKKLLIENGFDFVNIKSISIDYYNLNEYWDNQYIEIIKEVNKSLQ